MGSHHCGYLVGEEGGSHHCGYLVVVVGLFGGWAGWVGSHHCGYLVVVVGLFGGEEGGQQGLDVLLDSHG